MKVASLGIKIKDEIQVNINPHYWNKAVCHRILRVFLMVAFMFSTLYGNVNARPMVQSDGVVSLPNIQQDVPPQELLIRNGFSADPLSSVDANGSSNRIYLKNMAPPKSVDPSPLYHRMIQFSPVFCPEGSGYCYNSLSGFFTIDSQLNTYNSTRALSSGGDCNFGSGNYTDVLAPGGSEAWIIFDLGEVFEISQFLSWDLHHGTWWLDFSEDGINWSSFASGTTVWYNEHCTGNLYDRSSSPVSVRYIRYTIHQNTNVGDAYRIAWFSFRSNTPSKRYPRYLSDFGQSSGQTKGGSDDCRDCDLSSSSSALGQTGDPVNALTGGYDYSVGDLSIPTSAGPLIFQRSYSSDTIRLGLYSPGIDTSLGYGWTHNQDIYLDLSDPDQVWFKAQSANRYLFTRNTDGSFSPYVGVKATLNFNSSTDQYTLIDSGQNTYNFDNSGKLLTWTNDTGLQFTYSYEGNLLNRVIAPDNSRYLQFSYTNNLLTGVSDNNGRQLTYSYENGNLTSFTNELGITWTYSYDLSHHMTAVALTGGNGLPNPKNLIRNIYDDKGRVVCQQEGDKYPALTQYKVLVDDPVCTTDQYNIEYCQPASQQVSCQQANGKEAVATSFRYDIFGNTTTQNTLNIPSTLTYNQNLDSLSGQADAYGNATDQQLDVNFRPISLTDAANNSTQLGWSADGSNLTSITDALNRTTSLEYDSRNHLTLLTNPDDTVTKLVYNTPGATDPLTGVLIYNPAWDEDLLLMQIDNYVLGSTDTDTNLATRYTYTTVGDVPEPKNLLRRIDPPGPDACYVYDLFGQQTKVFENCVDMDPATGAADEDLLSGIVYDSLGRLESSTDSKGRVTRNFYYNLDDNVDVVIQNYDSTKAPYQDGLWNFATVYTYDFEGKLLETVSNAFDGDLTGDGLIEPALSLDLNNDGTPEYRLEIDPSKPGFNNISQTVYNGLGQVTETISNAWPGQPVYYLDLYNLSTRSFYDRAGQSVATVANYTSANLPGWGVPVQVDFDGDALADAVFEINPNYPEFNQVSRTIFDKAGRVSITIQAAWPGKANYYQPEGSNSIYNIVTANEYDAVGNVTKVVNNYDPDWVDVDADGFSFPLSLDPGSTPVTIIVDPDAPDHNQITCTTYDKLNRTQFTRTACVPGKADYFQMGNNLYNLVDYFVYDEMGQQLASVRNYYDPELDGILELSSQYNFITKNYYDDLGRMTYSVGNFVGDLTSSIVPVFDPIYPDRNLVTRYYYDADGRQYAVVQNYWEPAASADGELTQSEIEAGLPDKNLVNRSYYDSKGQVVYTVQNYVGNLASSVLPPFDSSTPDRNLISRSIYTEDGRSIASIDPGGVITRTYFDALDRPFQTVRNLVDPAYATVEELVAAPIPPAYDPGNPDQNVHSTTIYDSIGNAIATIDNAGVITRTYSDALNRPVAVVQNLVGQDAQVVSPPAYDPNFPDRNVLTQTGYNLAGSAIRSTDAIGTITQVCYDSLSRSVKTIVNPTVPNPCQDYSSNSATDYDQVSQSVYDISGNQVFLMDSTGNLREFAFDNLGRLIRQADSLQNSTQYVYDAAGNQVELIDANQVATRYEYDAIGRLTAVVENYQSGVPPTQEINVRTQYSYDAAGNRTQIQDGLNHLTTFTYDALGRLVSESDALSQVTVYAYDVAGNRKSMLDANGAVTSFVYDQLNRLTGIDYPEPDTDVTFTYNAAGARQTMTDGIGTTSWAYDDLGRTQSILDANNQRIAYGYDAAGNRTRLIYPDAKTVSFGYDAAGRLRNVTDWADQITEYSYDLANRIAAMTIPNGIQAGYQYDTAGKLSDIIYSKNQNVISQYHYDMDPLGNRIHTSELVQPEGTLLPTVSISVSDSSGNRLAGLRIDVMNGVDETGISAFTDKDGIARINLATPGSYRFRINIPGSAYYSGEYDHCMVPGCTTVDIVMPRIDGLVRSEAGYWEPGMEVVAYSDAGPTPYRGISDWDGKFVVYAPAGCYRLHTERIGQQAFSQRVCIDSGHSETATINLSGASSTTVSALDDAGNPQPGVPIYVFAGEVYTGHYGVTDANGNVTIDLPEDNYRYSPVPPEEPLPLEVSIFVNNAYSETEVYALSGSEADGYKIFTGRSGITDINGSIEFLLPQNGIYRFRFESGDQVYYTDLCDPSTCSIVDFLYPDRRSVTVTVLDELSMPVSSGNVFAYNGDTYMGYSYVNWRNGQAYFSLPTGDYWFRADFNGTSLSSQSQNRCTVPGCSAMEIKLPGETAVSVVDAGGSPQPDVVVYAFRGETYEQRVYSGYSAKTDAQGVATLPLPEGNYWFDYQRGNMAINGGIVEACVVPACANSTITRNDGTEITYAYDPLNRLTAADYNTGQYFHYTYDAVGNRLQENRLVDTQAPEVVNTYAYDDANRLTGVNGVSYTWDANGNLLSDGASIYSYDHANRLVGVTQGSDVYNFAYLGSGDRIGQTVNGVATTYSLDLNAGLTQVLSDGANIYLYGNGRIAQMNGVDSAYFLGDALGSVRQLTDASGAVTLTKVYEPYGEVLYSQGSGASSYGYTGEWLDETGLINLRARYYSSDQGRFINRDIWSGNNKLPISYNKWGYGYSNPINRTDPSGMCPDNDGDGKCDSGWWCDKISDPEKRTLCQKNYGCKEDLCPMPPNGLSNETPIYRAYKKLFETPCKMSRGNKTPWWKTKGALEREYASIDQTMLVAILIYTEASPLHLENADPDVIKTWIEMLGNRYSYSCDKFGGCDIKNGRRELQGGLRRLLSFSARFQSYGYDSGITNLLDKYYGPPAWAFNMAVEVVKPRTWNLDRPYGVFNTQTVEEQEYFYKQYLEYGEGSTQREGVYYSWGSVKNLRKDKGDMFILTFNQQQYHEQQHPEFPIGGNLP